MKNLKIIACVLCLITALPFVANAQWRWGVDGSFGISPAYQYDSDGFYTGKDNYGRYLGQAHVMFDYMLPRRWTPNYLVLSLRVGIGFMQAEDNSSFSDSYHSWAVDRTETMARGVDMPLEVEAKYLVSNNFRIYLNGGATPFIVVGSESCFDDEVDAPVKTGHIGYQFGAGFEFKNFRIGYKNFSLAKTLTEGEYGNNLKSAHAVSIGFWFNGNRFLKKRSKLKLY